VAALLVLDEQLTAKSLVLGLESRGYDVKTVHDFGVSGKPDPDVVRTINSRCRRHWVLVTMDIAIVEQHQGFDWDRYAIAWIIHPEKLKGAAVEKAKANILHRWAHDIAELGKGDHHTYYEKRRLKTRPSLDSQLRRQL
jgi:hypothetical protein